jgi:hypothetical protein
VSVILVFQFRRGKEQGAKDKGQRSRGKEQGARGKGPRQVTLFSDPLSYCQNPDLGNSKLCSTARISAKSAMVCRTTSIKAFAPPSTKLSVVYTNHSSMGPHITWKTRKKVIVMRRALRERTNTTNTPSIYLHTYDP